MGFLGVLFCARSAPILCATPAQRRPDFATPAVQGVEAPARRAAGENIGVARKNCRPSPGSPRIDDPNTGGLSGAYSRRSGGPGLHTMPQGRRGRRGGLSGLRIRRAVQVIFALLVRGQGGRRSGPSGRAYDRPGSTRAAWTAWASGGDGRACSVCIDEFRNVIPTGRSGLQRPAPLAPPRRSTFVPPPLGLGGPRGVSKASRRPQAGLIRHERPTSPNAAAVAPPTGRRCSGVGRAS